MADKTNKSTKKRAHKNLNKVRIERAILYAGGALILLALVLVALPRLNRGRDRAAVPVDSAVITLPPQGAETFVFEATPEPTAAPGVPADGLTALDRPTAVPTVPPTATPTPRPTATPEPTATPAPTATFAPGEPFEYLPVINSVDTGKKWIAITVDDCFQVGNLQKIMKCAYKNKAMLTLFPIGQNLSLSGMKKTLKTAVKLGYEIENHTWSHARVFRLTEEDMAAEIWKQDQALNKCLGVTYQEHFFRCMGGDGEMDQRTHNYLKQLGYKAIAHWSYSGSDADINQIKEQVRPGAILLFHTTDRDTKILLKLIPWIAKKGYKMVTLNKLVGFKENKVSKLKSKKMPEPRDYIPDYRTIHKGEYSWMVVLLQNKLRRMGYLNMDGPTTGYYGDQTAQAVAAFQKANGIDADGEADAMTQQAILAS